MTTPTNTPKAPSFGMGGRTELTEIVQYLFGEIVAVTKGVDALTTALADDELDQAALTKAAIKFADTEKRLSVLNHFREVFIAEVETSAKLLRAMDRFEAMSIPDQRKTAVWMVLDTIDSTLGNTAYGANDAIQIARAQIAALHASNSGDRENAEALHAHAETLIRRCNEDFLAANPPQSE